MHSPPSSASPRPHATPRSTRTSRSATLPSGRPRGTAAIPAGSELWRAARLLLTSRAVPPSPPRPDERAGARALGRGHQRAAAEHFPRLRHPLFWSPAERTSGLALSVGRPRSPTSSARLGRSESGGPARRWSAPTAPRARSRSTTRWALSGRGRARHGGAPGERKTAALVPLGDLFNHAEEERANVESASDAAGAAFASRRTADPRQRTHALVRRAGRAVECDLMLDYGFCLPYSSHDTAAIDISPPAAASQVEWLRRLQLDGFAARVPLAPRRWRALPDRLPRAARAPRPRVGRRRAGSSAAPSAPRCRRRGSCAARAVQRSAAPRRYPRSLAGRATPRAAGGRRRRRRGRGGAATACAAQWRSRSANSGCSPLAAPRDPPRAHAHRLAAEEPPPPTRPRAPPASAPPLRSRTTRRSGGGRRRRAAAARCAGCGRASRGAARRCLRGERRPGRPRRMLRASSTRGRARSSRWRRSRISLRSTPRRRPNERARADGRHLAAVQARNGGRQQPHLGLPNVFPFDYEYGAAAATACSALRTSPPARSRRATR